MPVAQSWRTKKLNVPEIVEKLDMEATEEPAFSLRSAGRTGLGVGRDENPMHQRSASGRDYILVPCFTINIYVSKESWDTVKFEYYLAAF